MEPTQPLAVVWEQIRTGQHPQLPLALQFLRVERGVAGGQQVEVGAVPILPHPMELQGLLVTSQPLPKNPLLQGRWEAVVQEYLLGTRRAGTGRRGVGRESLQRGEGMAKRKGLTHHVLE